MTQGEIIWGGTLDGKWRCEVQRVSEGTGLLTIINADTDETLLSNEVLLAYGAEFGPDWGDVGHWQDICEKAVDEREEA